MSQVSENPFKNSDTNKRYYTYDYYLRRAFGEKCAKITLDAGFTCPNIDGTRGRGGCIYCSGGSRASTLIPEKSLSEQYESQRALVRAKWQGVTKFIPYLQAYTNTHTSPEKLSDLLRKVAALEGAVMVDIATRADCLEDEKIKILNDLSAKIPVTVELGLQSSNDKTAELINRCHTYAELTDAIKRLRAGAPSVKIAIHIINGLPSEGYAEMMQTARDVSVLLPDIVKIHLLHVIEGTPLAKIYKNGGYTPLEMNEYVKITCDQLEILPPDTVIERVTGDGERKTLLAPLWSLKKTAVINEIDKELYRRGSYQGKKYGEKS